MFLCCKEAEREDDGVFSATFLFALNEDRPPFTNGSSKTSLVGLGDSLKIASVSSGDIILFKKSHPTTFCEVALVKQNK